MSLRAAIIPGNGCSSGIERCMWYGWARAQLEAAGIPTALTVMPDPYTARESIWIPYMERELACDAHTVVIGHSSGAEAAMRFAETHTVAGIVLLAPCVTDMGDANERASGYYSRPWQWAAIRQHTKFVIQFTSTDDPLVPYEEQQQVRSGLSAADGPGAGTYEYHEFADRGHFQNSRLQPLITAVCERVKSL
eukprot:m.101140 g.101140  ORF g.101140 m.101140 type:complete len:193 (-) comp8776_c0_seq1:129-707(-)